jgi:hypothetical protein
VPKLRRRSQTVAVGCAVLVGVVVWASGAAATLQRATVQPPGTPALDQMALAVGDLPPGAVVRREGYVRDRRFDSYYVREFAPGATLGRSRLTNLESDVGLAASATDATRLVTTVSSSLHARSGRRSFARSALIDAGWDSKALKITSVGFRKVAAGDSALFAVMTLSLPGPRRFVLVVGLTRVDRAIQLLYALGVPNAGVSPSEPIALLAVVAQRMRDALVPVDIVAPTIVGVAQVGQGLSAAAGTWSNAPTAFAIQWLRCEENGGACSAIAGATGTTYSPTLTDVGSTLEVSVVAANGAGSSKPAASSPTAAIAAAPPG